MKKTLLIGIIVSFYGCTKSNVKNNTLITPPTITGSWTETANLVTYNQPSSIYGATVSESVDHPYTFGFIQTLQFLNNATMNKQEIKVTGVGTYLEFNGTYKVDGTTLNISKINNYGQWDLQVVAGITTLVDNKNLTPISNEVWSASVSDTTISMKRTGTYIDVNGNSYAATFIEAYKKSK